MTSAKLLIRSPGQQQKEVQLTGGVSIGRAFDNAIRVDVEGVSRYHAIIEQKPDGFWLSDLGSRNGTAVNGVAVATECRLEDGNMILLGGVSALEFRADKLQPQNGDASTRKQEEDRGKSRSPAAASGGTALKMGLAIGAVVILVFIAARLFLPAASGTGTRSSRDGSVTQPQAPEPSGGAAADGGAGQKPDDRQTEQDKPELMASTSDSTMAPTPLEVRSMVDGLARQISGRGGYEFQSEFIERVRRAIPEYRGRALNDARPYAHDIEDGFHAQALDPFLGLVLAMSVSRFNNTDTGIWRLPPSLARSNGYLKADEDERALRDSKRSAQIAAAYMKNLQNLFGGKQQFMYAVAFYGEPLPNASDALVNLESLDPQGTRRLDFWSMVQSRVVKPEQADRVVRFFAAGIVGEHPAEFGLNARPLSSLSQ